MRIKHSSRWTSTPVALVQYPVAVCVERVYDDGNLPACGPRQGRGHAQLSIKINPLTRAQQIVRHVERVTETVFVVCMLSAVALVIGGVFLGAFTGTKAIERMYIGVSPLVAAVGALSYATRCGANAVLTVMQVRKRRLSLRRGISGFVAYGGAAAFAVYIAVIAVLWAVAYLSTHG